MLVNMMGLLVNMGLLSRMVGFSPVINKAFLYGKIEAEGCLMQLKI